MNKMEIVVAIIALIGLWLVAKAMWGFRRSKQTTSWLTAEGEVTCSELRTNVGNKGGVSYYADITYRYYIDGREYESTRVYFGSDFGSTYSEKRCARLVREYNEFSKVMVYYNPNKFAESVLEKGIHRELYWIFYIGAAIFFIDVFLYLGWLQKIANLIWPDSVN